MPKANTRTASIREMTLTRRRWRNSASSRIVTRQLADRATSAAFPQDLLGDGEVAVRYGDDSSMTVVRIAIFALPFDCRLSRILARSLPWITRKTCCAIDL
jgi:hypothetical protein